MQMSLMWLGSLSTSVAERGSHKTSSTRLPKNSVRLHSYRLGVGREWWEVVQEQGDVLDVPSLLRHGPHCWLLCRPHSRTSLQPYSYVISEPLGRSAYKEHKQTDYYYDDGCEPCGSDTFSREPFIVKFSSPYTEVQEFVLVPLHTPPSEAVAEIDALYDVYLDVINKWGTDNILFLGDFNADCSYVGPQDWPSIRLRTSNAFQWLIPDSADTTVSYTDCRVSVPGAAGPLAMQSPGRRVPRERHGASEIGMTAAPRDSPAWPVPAPGTANDGEGMKRDKERTAGGQCPSMERHHSQDHIW
uniref:Deoxyribonuclease 1 n=1 Tax=Chelydra serpentina TaxID=8475 RepID=A0A8C3XIX1_CHESE